MMVDRVTQCGSCDSRDVLSLYDYNPNAPAGRRIQLVGMKVVEHDKLVEALEAWSVGAGNGHLLRLMSGEETPRGYLDYVEKAIKDRQLPDIAEKMKRVGAMLKISRLLPQGQRDALNETIGSLDEEKRKLEKTLAGIKKWKEEHPEP
jgi:hypothetical protein